MALRRPRTAVCQERQRFPEPSPRRPPQSFFFGHTPQSSHEVALTSFLPFLHKKFRLTKNIKLRV